MRTWLTPTPRIAMGLMALCVTLFIVADLLFGIVANRSQQALDVRSRVAETAAAQTADLLRGQDLRRVARALAAARHGNPDLVSAAVRDSGGTLVASQGAHAPEWAGRNSHESTVTHIVVPIHSAQGLWGRVEMEFEPVAGAGAWWRDRILWLALGLPLLGLAFFYLYLRHTLTYLNPMAVVPDRLRHAFDGLTAGVALLDWQGRVVLANAALREIAAVHSEKLMHGHPLEQAARIELAQPGEALPWTRVLKDGQSVRGTRVYVGGGAHRAVCILNCSPILDPRGRVRGCLATIDDVTAIERSNEELREANAELERSRQHIEAQNQELIKLATRDGLTGLLNRRAFFDSANAVLANQSEGIIAVMMLDVDHFKSFNDKYGHAVGDEVLQRVAKHLAATLRLPDVVARYGGEEFCVLAQVADTQTALDLAERVRRAIATRAGSGLREGSTVNVTVSIGVALTPPAEPDLCGLLKAADAALYDAKRGGRNRVVLAGVTPSSHAEAMITLH